MYVISSISPSSRWDESLYESSDKVTDVSPELAIGMVILEVILLAAELIWLLPLIWFHLSMIPSISRAFSWFLSAFDNDFWLEFSLGIGGELFDLLDPDLLVEVLEVCTIDSSTFQGFYYKTLVKWNNLWVMCFFKPQTIICLSNSSAFRLADRREAPVGAAWEISEIRLFLLL